MSSTHRIVLTSRARTELSAAADYIQIHSSPGRATAVVERILASIATLAALPGRYREVGRSRRHGTPVHVLVVDPYLIYYRVDDRPPALSVLTIRHGARRQPRRFD